MLQNQSFKWPPKDKNPSVKSIKRTLLDKNWHIISYKKYLGPFGTYKETRDFDIEAVNIFTNDKETLMDIRDKIHNSSSYKRKITKSFRYCNSSSSEKENENKHSDNKS